MPEQIVVAVNDVIAKKWYMKLASYLIDIFPMSPTNPMSIKHLIKKVKQNSKCLIFPEGRISVTGTLMKIYEGPGLVANKADAPVLPIRIEGANHSIFSRLKGKVKRQLFRK